MLIDDLAVTYLGSWTESKIIVRFKRELSTAEREDIRSQFRRWAPNRVMVLVDPHDEIEVIAC